MKEPKSEAANQDGSPALMTAPILSGVQTITWDSTDANSLAKCSHGEAELSYLAAHADARWRMGRGERQRKCSRCLKWFWETEFYVMELEDVVRNAMNAKPSDLGDWKRETRRKFPVFA